MSEPVIDVEARLRSLPGTTDDVPADLADRVLRRVHRRRNRRRALAVTGTAIAAVLLVAGVNATTSRLAGPEPASDAPALKPRENVLIIGSDEGPRRVGVRPDTIILASIDTRTGRATTFGFPRNLGHVPFAAGTGGAAAWPDGFWCLNPGTGLNDCLLNAVWSWAESPEGRKAYPVADPGLAATKDAVEGVSGLPVTQTLVVTMKGLQQLVDAVGGVRVDVQERLPIGGDSEHPVAVGGWIEPGQDVLDGYHALWFARSRWSTSDYDRMRRQQCLLSALAEKADARTLALNWSKLAPVLRDNVRSSLEVSDLRAWVKVADSVRAGRVRTLAFTDQLIADRDDPDYAKIHATIANALRADATDPTATNGVPTAAAKPVSC